MAHERGIKLGAEHNYEHVAVPEFDGSTNEAEWTDPLVTWFNNAANLPEMKANFATRYNQETEVMLEKKLGRCKTSEMPYELVPECRSCLQVFGGWEELATHLHKQPRHKMRFRYKKWNELYRWADQRGKRKCRPAQNRSRVLPDLTITWRKWVIAVPRSCLDTCATTMRTRNELNNRLSARLRRNYAANAEAVEVAGVEEAADNAWRGEREREKIVWQQERAQPAIELPPNLTST